MAAADRSGATWDVKGWAPAVRTGLAFRAPRDEELIPLPPGATLQYLDGRLPLGWPRGSQPGDEPAALTGSLAVAAQLPSGYCRTLLPAYRRAEGPPYLPFFGYTAVVYRDGKPYCAAIRTDRNPHWQPQHYGQPGLAERIEARLEASPENRVLRQLKVCSLEYGCYNAQNVFLGRWEGAVTVSPACNAECVGCISLQPDELPASPQTRFRFVPTVEEVVEVGLAHLQGPDSIFSFGQGCEGEPLLQGKLIAQSIRALRAQTAVGTIHLNSNASKPKEFALVAEAGLDSLRISLNSARPDPYTAYYQPRGYEFADLLRCAQIACDHDVAVDLNYLHMPGWNDAVEEVEALIELVQRYRVRMIQMRNLNIDPELYASTLPPADQPTMGMVAMLAELRRHCPDLLIGNHTLPRRR